MTPHHESIDLRINGQVFDEVIRRNAMIDGYPGGDAEIVVQAPGLGSLVLTDDCVIEISDHRQPWETISLDEFKRIVQQAVEEEHQNYGAVAR